MSLSFRFLHQPLLIFFLLVASSTVVQAYFFQETRLSNNLVAENQPAGTVVGRFVPARATFALAEGVPDNASFTINGRRLLTAAPFDFEAQSQYTIAVAITPRNPTEEDSTVVSLFDIIVEDANDPPVIIGQTALSTDPDVPLTITPANLIVTDPDADDPYPQGYTVTVAPGEGYTASGPTVTPLPGVTGPLSVPLTVSDGQVSSTPFVATVTVNVPSPVNQPPVADAGPDITVDAPDGDRPVVVTLDGSASTDPDGDVLTYRWATRDQGEIATGVQVDYPFPVGTTQVSLIITDPAGAMATDDLTVDVQAPAPSVPRFSFARRVYQANEDFANPRRVVAQPEDPNQIVTYEIFPEEVDFATLTADNSNGIYVFEPLPNRNGEEEFTVTATNEQANSFEQAFTLRVDAVNDAPSFAGVAGNDQQAALGSEPVVIPNFATDITAGPADESEQALAFRVNAEDPALFAQPPTISPDGTLTFQPSDERDGTSAVAVTLVDDGPDRGDNVNRSAPQSFNVAVLAPQVSPPTLDNTVVNENQPAGTVLGELNAEGISPDYRITSITPDDRSAFRIAGDQLVTQRVLNAEEVSSYEIVIEATAGFIFRERASSTFTLTVQNVEEPPTGITLSNTAVAEGVAVGTPVGVLAAVGGAPEVPATFALVNGPGGEDNAQFAVSGNQLLINTVPDAETQAQYNVRLQATADGVSPPQNFVITITNVAEPPTDITLSSDAVAENQPVGTLVGALSAVGGSAGATVTYSLSGADAAAFTVDGARLLTNAILNFEVKPTYAITVTATGDGAFAKDFVINVTDVAEPPTDIALDNSTVDEGVPVGTAVGNLVATGGEGAIVFTLVPGPGSEGNDNFVIEGGVLRTAAVFDFEAQTSYSIRVRATGDGALAKVLTVDVIDQPDPPTDITLSATTVVENAEPGTVIGQVSATGGEGPYTFTIVGPGNNFAIEGDELQVVQGLDFETTPTLDVTVRATNADGSFEKRFAITITNQEEPPTDITLSSATVAENQPAGTTVGTLAATGGAGPITFSLVGGAGSGGNNQFVIEGNELLTSAPLDFEEQPSYRVRIQATGDGSFAQAFTVTVTNVPEPPTEILLSSTTVAENSEAGTPVGTLSTVGGVGNITYALVGNDNDNANFRIVGDRLLTGAVFDREARATYQVRIRAAGDGALAADFTITVANVDEPPVLSGIENTFLEYAEGDVSIVVSDNIEVADPDSDALTRAVVSFTNNTYVSGEDELIVDGDVASEWDPARGTLTISGPLTPAEMRDVLRRVRYNNLKEVNPTASTRRVAFRVFDGTNASNQQERFIRVSDSNIPPLLADVNLSTGEDDAITIAAENFANAYGGDEDGTGFSGTIFVVTLPEQGTLTVGERVLTDDDIGGAGFAVSFEEPLVYTPTADFFGTDSFQWTALDSEDEPGIAANANVNVIPANDPPTINAPATLNVEENTEDPLTDISITEPDNDLVRVTLSVDAGTLTILEDFRSNVTLVTGTGENDTELVFEGAPSNVNEVLVNLIYVPAEESATLDITVADTPADGSEPLVDEASVALNVIPQNDDPVLAAISPDTLFYTENSAPLVIADGLLVTDEENDDIVAAVVAIDSGATPDDQLLLEDTEAITATLADGVLTLTGAAPPDVYQAALRRVAFQNTSDQPDTTPRTLRFEVTDATGGRSNALTRPVVVIAVEDTLRIVDLEEEPRFFAIGGSPVLVSRTVGLEDPDSDVVDRVTVFLDPATYVAAEDSLGIDPVGAVVADWNPATGTLTLSGSATVAEYEQSLRTLTYYNRNATAAESSRLLRIQGFSGETASNVATREIRIIDNVAPVVNDLSIAVSSGLPYAFSLALFGEQYTDEDNQPSDGPAAIRIITLPRQGTLLLGETPVTLPDVQAGLVLTPAEVATLTYISNQGYLGEDEFAWNASDGAEFAEAPAQVLITVSDLRVDLGEAVEKCLNVDPVTLEATVTGGTSPYTYRWSSDQDESIAEDGEVLSVVPSATTLYAVTVTDAAGISISDSVRVSVIECPEQELSIPSAFTPDGDGVNDVWEVGNILTYETSVVEVYDRYGHRLFRTEDYAQPWDGTYQNEVLPVGTYYYTISLNDGAAHYKGSVTILK